MLLLCSCDTLQLHNKKMTRQILSGWKRLAVAAGIAASALNPLAYFSTARAEDVKEPAKQTQALDKVGDLSVREKYLQDLFGLSNISLRVGAEASDPKLLNLSDQYRSVFEISANKYPVAPDNYPLLRLYNYTGKVETAKGTDFKDWTALGFNIPLRTSVFNSNLSLFGVDGDFRGKGLQEDLELKLSPKTSLYLAGNYEDSDIPEARRKGFGLDLRLDKWLVGGAYDIVSTPKGDTKYSLIRGAFDISKNDTVGAMFRVAETETDRTNTVLGYYGHYGKDEKWGTRTWVSHDWNREKDSRTTNFDSIIVLPGLFGEEKQGPTFWNARNSPYQFLTERISGGKYSPSQVENALSASRTPVGMRTRGGPFIELAGCFGEIAGSRSGFYRGDIGYRFNVDTEIGNFSLAPSVWDRYDWSDKSPTHMNSLGAGLLGSYTPGKGEYGRLNFEFNMQEKGKWQAGLFWTIPLGSGKK